MLFSPCVPGGVAAHGSEPIPKRIFALKKPGVAGDPNEGFLEGFAGLGFVAARDHQKKTIKPVEIKRLELAEGLVFSGRQPACQRRDGARRRIVGLALCHSG